MTQFRRKPLLIEATRWFKNGDHPLDYVGDQQWPDDNGEEVVVAGGMEMRATTYTAEFRKTSDWEGAIVRRFRHPGISGIHVCGTCGHAMNDHGWIDSKNTLNPSGCTVCPGDWVLEEASDPSKYYPCKPDIFEATYEPQWENLPRIETN